MADEHDPVPGRDAEDRDESDQRSEGKNHACQSDAGPASDEGESKAGQDESGQPGRTEIGVKDEEDSDEGDEKNAIFGGFLGRGFVFGEAVFDGYVGRDFRPSWRRKGLACFFLQSPRDLILRIQGVGEAGR
jgi:hypothetical protein